MSSTTSFTDNGDGTITTITNYGAHLMWEKKSPAGSRDVHDMGFVYSWSKPGPNPTEPDGTAFTLFLRSLNDQSFANHSDWRLPTQNELLSIVDNSKYPSGNAWINPIFGPTMAAHYLTNETFDIGPPTRVTAVRFGGEGMYGSMVVPKVDEGYVRAVRYV